MVIWEISIDIAHEQLMTNLPHIMASNYRNDGFGGSGNGDNSNDGGVSGRNIH